MNRPRKPLNRLLDSDWLVRWSWWLGLLFWLFWLGVYAALQPRY